jgi:hypothetical protein
MTSDRVNFGYLQDGALKGLSSLRSLSRAVMRRHRSVPVLEAFPAGSLFSCLLPTITRHLFLICCVIATLFFLGLTPIRASAEKIDRLLVAVNGKVITEGDLKVARFLNDILTFHATASKPSDGEELQRLVDLELLRQELENFPSVPGQEEQVESQMASLKKSYADRGGLTMMLQKLGLRESELRAYLRLQSSVLRFIDFRFRPFISVPEEEIREYYRMKLLPQAQKPGVPPPALEDVSSQILAILTEEKVNSSLNQWLQDSRRHSKIEYFGEDDSTAGR